MQLGDAKGVIGAIIYTIAGAFAWAFAAARGHHTGQLGNTALVHHNGRLLALMESGFPFLLRVCRGFIESIGAFTWAGALQHAITAHPKIDPDTGELHTFCYQCAPNSFIALLNWDSHHAV